MKKLLKLIALVTGVLMMMACNPDEGSNDFVDETPTEITPSPIDSGEDNEEIGEETPTEENENYIYFEHETNTPKYFTLKCDSITSTWFKIDGTNYESKKVISVVAEKEYTIETAMTKGIISFDTQGKTITINVKPIVSEYSSLDIDVYYDPETKYFYVEW